MRVSASLGLVVLLASLATCEQRNFDRCQVTGTDFQCETGKFCKADADSSGLGTCVTSECNAIQVPSGCAADKPICTAAGHCVACDPASNVNSKGQCFAVNPKLPACVAPTTGSTDYICAECSTTADCTGDATKPACDATTHTCRPCSLHSECPAPGVCVKDDTLSTLAKPYTPLFRGMCATPDQVIIVDETTCPTLSMCTLATQVSQASPTKPFVLVRNNYTGGMLVISPIANLPEQHLIGGNADTPPAGLAMGTLPSAAIHAFSTTSPTVTVAAGASVTIEGFVLHDNDTSLSCNSGGTTVTSIKLLRSIIMSSTLAIKTTPLCKLTLDQSWIGTPPNTANLGGNDEAMRLDSTQFDIINSVFNHNFKPLVFGGITLTDSQPGNLVGHIVNSTFYRQEPSDSTKPSLAIYCANKPTTLTLFNTLFVNAPGVTATLKKPYVSPVCGTATNFAFGYVATDESPAPAGMGVVTGVTDSIFTTPASSVLSLLPSAPSGVLTGGVPSFGGINSPTVDALSNSRSKSKLSIGAYEQVPPAP